ncbi:MAG: energy transducer TonB [Roseivirga sp.]|nr:energy transducer TonB [Roseivirga sp.]
MESKKNPNKEVAPMRSLFLSLGLCISMALVLAAFELKSQPVHHQLPPVLVNSTFPGVEIIPPTEFLPPKPPPLNFPEIITIPDDVDVDYEEPEFTFEPIIDEIESIPIIEMPEEQPENNDFMVVEHPAAFPGGLQEWQQFLSKNTRYPRFAQRNHIEGKVHLSFYVDTQGNISDIKVARGIGGGCDEEAIRVLKSSPRWNPGLQRGVPVKSPMSIFIHFKLK